MEHAKSPKIIKVPGTVKPSGSMGRKPRAWARKQALRLRTFGMIPLLDSRAEEVNRYQACY